jgi:Ca-activated chloride channel homolog
LFLFDRTDHTIYNPQIYLYMRTSIRRGCWLFPIFQIPLMLLVLCLILATLFWLLGLGRPNIAVAIVLDLSGSTYDSTPKAPNTILAREIEAVNSYLTVNSELKSPNKVQIFGFRSNQTLPLTDSFETDSRKINDSLRKKLDSPNLFSKPEPEQDDLNQPIQEGIKALSNIQNHCRELITVSDQEVQLSSSNLISEASKHQIKLNSIVFNGHVAELRTTALSTGGIYLSGADNNLETFFVNVFFPRFNSNRRWIVLWLGGAWISLMWALTLPLDQVILQGWMKMPMNLSGGIAIGNALFWTTATLIAVWQLWKIFGLPFFSSC